MSMLLAIGGSDRCTAVVETHTWEVLGEIERSGVVSCVAWSPNDGGRRLAVRGQNGAVAVVDIRSKTVVAEIDLRSTKDGRGGGEEGERPRSAVKDVCWMLAIHTIVILCLF